MHKLTIALSMLAFLASIAAFTSEQETICEKKFRNETFNPELEKLNIEIGKDVKMFRDDNHLFKEKYALFQEKCKIVQNKMIAFQSKMTLDVSPCLEDDNKKAFQAYLQFTRHFSDFVCQMSEKAYYVFDDFNAVLSENVVACFKGVEAKIKEVPNQWPEEFFDDFCSVTHQDALKCVKKLFPGEKSDTLLVALINHFKNVEFDCDATDKTTIEQNKHATKYYNFLVDEDGSSFIFQNFLTTPGQTGN